MDTNDKTTTAACVGSTPLLDVSLENGKYRVVVEESGGLWALRYDEPWRNCVGDSLIYCLASEVQRLREELEKTSNELDHRPEQKGE